MRVGVFLPNAGPSANPEAVIAGARQAEQLGYDSVWVLDRLLYPVKPRNPYPASGDGRLPDSYKNVLDPLLSLTFAAAQTKTIALGTCILDIPFYNPLVLARAITTLDVFSGGRVRLGFGQGWSEDEFEAVGAPPKGRGARADEFLDALKAIWTTDPVEFHGRVFSIPASIIGPKPVQRPHPPIFLAAFTSTALKRVAIRSDGWMPARIPFDDLERMLGELRSMAQAAGRDPQALALEVVAIPQITASPLGSGRAPFSGSTEQIKEDAARAKALGATELILQIELDEPTASLLALMETLMRLVT
jgi:probable F420-dependent oxidoreductase